MLPAAGRILGGSWMVLTQLLAILLIMIQSCHGGVDWCSLTCQPGQKNTMCIYKPQTSIGGCKDIVDSQTPSGRSGMLHLHNEYRNELAGGKKPGWPTAANMRQMSWDHDNERVALRWAQQCQAGHDKCRRTPDFEYVGQNYGMGGHSASFPNPNNSFVGWVSEISMIKEQKSMIQNFQGGDWGHFTQVIWAKSYKLGCGQIHTIQNNFKTTILICNYGPGGNIQRTQMYEEGPPCSKCPDGTKCYADSSYPNLCALPTDDRKPSDIPGGISLWLSSPKLIVTVTLLSTSVYTFYAI